MTPEQEAAIRQVAAEATAQAPAVVVLDPLSIRDLLAELDAARAENARLRAALETAVVALEAIDARIETARKLKGT